MYTVKDLIDRLSGYDPAEPVAASLWFIGDVKAVDPSLTDEEAEEILHTVTRRQDAEIGINWQVIETNIDLYKS